MVKVGRINKSAYKFDWTNGYTIERKLTRSFDTLEQAQKFAENKRNADIFRSKGRYTVEWLKVVDNN